MNFIFDLFKSKPRRGIFTYRDGIQEDCVSNQSQIMGAGGDRVGYGYEYKLHISIPAEKYGKFKQSIIQILTENSDLAFKYTNDDIIKKRFATDSSEELVRLYNGAQFTVYLPLLHSERAIVKCCVWIRFIRRLPEYFFQLIESQIPKKRILHP